MTDIRSKRCVFVSHCLLAQGVMAQGIVRKYSSIFRPILEFCLEHDLNVLQMPCPEAQCTAGGIERQPHGKQWYEERGLRTTAREIAERQSEYMEALVKKGFEVVGVIGVDLSPACAVNYLNRGLSIYSDRGIYVEELQRCLEKRGLQVRFVGVNQRWEKKLQRDLQELIFGDETRIET